MLELSLADYDENELLTSIKGTLLYQGLEESANYQERSMCEMLTKNLMHKNPEKMQKFLQIDVN